MAWGEGSSLPLACPVAQCWSYAHFSHEDDAKLTIDFRLAAARLRNRERAMNVAASVRITWCQILRATFTFASLLMGILRLPPQDELHCLYHILHTQRAGCVDTFFFEQNRVSVIETMRAWGVVSKKVDGRRWGPGVRAHPIIHGTKEGMSRGRDGLRLEKHGFVPMKEKGQK